jgi:DNA-binding MltR family transcriptional regulator
MAKKRAASADATVDKVTRALSESHVDIATFSMDLEGESDRAVVIVAVAKLDQLLRDLIVARLVPSSKSDDELVDGDRPLGTFSARISIAFRLGLIDAEFARSLDLIRRIRNEFAHEARLASLSSDEHIKRVKELARPFHRDPKFLDFMFRNRKTVRRPASKSYVTKEFIACVTMLAGWMRAATEVITPLSSSGALRIFVRGDTEPG